MSSSDPLISVPLPTIKGREQLFEATKDSYFATANVEVIEFHDLPGCGPAWAEGADQAQGEYIQFGADDVVMHPNWWRKAIRYCDQGFLPAARVLNTDGSLQSCGDGFVEMKEGAIPEFTRSPIVSKAQWEQLSPLVSPFLRSGTLYYTDNVFTWAGRKLGMETVVCRSYEYTHHMAPSPERNGRMEHDFHLYLAYIRDHE